VVTFATNTTMMKLLVLPTVVLMTRIQEHAQLAAVEMLAHNMMEINPDVVPIPVAITIQISTLATQMVVIPAFNIVTLTNPLVKVM
jgi:hypothetical protein